MRERRYRWEWKLSSSPAALWPLVADTNRFNRDAGIGALEERGDPEVAAELRGGALSVEPFQASLKGLEDERVGIFRMTAPAEVRIDA
jgi:hypothetical protein